MDDFVKFFIEENKSGDSKDDILNAFRNLGGGDSMGQEAIDKYFKSHDTVYNYLASNLKDGDFVSFTNDLFCR